MCLNTIYLNNINLDYDNLDDDDPKNYIHVRLMAL